MAKAKNTEIIYNKELVEQGVELLTKCRADLFDADCLMYDAVIGITGATGFNLVDAAAGGIDINLPEQRVIGLREKTEHLIETITEAGHAIVAYSSNKDITLRDKLKGLFDEKATDKLIGGTLITASAPQVVYGPPTKITEEVSFEKGGQALYAPPKAIVKKNVPIKEEKITKKAIQAVYAPPPSRELIEVKIGEGEKPIQALYAAKPAKPIEGEIIGGKPIQALYAAAPAKPIEGEIIGGKPIISEPPVQALYAAPPAGGDIIGGAIGGGVIGGGEPIQALYAAAPAKPIVGEIIGGKPIISEPPVQALYAAPPTNEEIISGKIIGELINKKNKTK